MIDFAQLTPGGQVRRLRRLAGRALTAFGIEPISISLLGHFHNTTFAVTGPDAARYMLRIHRAGASPLDAPKRHSRIESELWWLDRLRADLDLPVPAAVRTPAGEGVITVAVEGVPDARLCSLFRWMDGRFLYRGLRPGHLEQVGRLTARMHEHSTQLTVPPGFDRQRVDGMGGETEEYTVRLFTDHWSTDAAALMQAVFERARQVRNELGSGPDSYGLIHADIHHHNYLVDGGRVRLIDFDDSGWGYYLYDLAVTALHVDPLPRGSALRAALLAGYRQVRNLSAAQEALIATFCMVRDVQDVAWNLQERDNVSFGSHVARIGDRLALLEQRLAAEK